ncbi:hypothetical protein Y032_0023g772 [Ancylostoma ceylanicum]|uniref:Uncharacterized protein n=1 Tax=Ancylostoma ceylanicum TaxID=53326 RepID=A0A016UY02_9BILA|nr:hypothetical protein Y032_0023g772 [Ancylostoma ceylanicum]
MAQLVRQQTPNIKTTVRFAELSKFLRVQVCLAIQKARFAWRYILWDFFFGNTLYGVRLPGWFASSAARLPKKTSPNVLPFNIRVQLAFCGTFDSAVKVVQVHEKLLETYGSVGELCSRQE